MKWLTVGELRKAMEDLPDDAVVNIGGRSDGRDVKWPAGAAVPVDRGEMGGRYLYVVRQDSGRQHLHEQNVKDRLER